MNATDCSFTASRAVRFFAAIAAAYAALGASAETKIFCSQIDGSGPGEDNKHIGSSSNRYSWGDGTNWTPQGVPTEDDTVKWAINSSSHRIAYVTLDNDYSVGWVTNKHRSLNLSKSGASDVVSLTVKGQLGSPDGYQQHVVNSGVKLIVDAGAALVGAHWDDTASTFTIGSGAEVDVYGDVESRQTIWTIPTGAVLRFAPSAYANFTSDGFTSNAGDVFNLTGGTAYFDVGLEVTGGNQHYANAINQSGGSVTFGGNFTSSVTGWTYTWSGGTLAITDDSTFGANVALVIPASATVSLDIASGKTFAAPDLSADSTASITVTGGGTFSIAPTTASIILQNGSIGLATSGTYDLSNVSVGSGAATVTLTAFGATINSLPAALAGVTFSADLSNVAAGMVILNSADSSVLAKVKSDLDASVPAGMALVVSGTTLSLEKDAGSDNTISASGDLLDDESWGGGEVPAADAEVTIAGEGVVATYSGGEVPAWALIEVKDGATLRIASAASGLPQIKLNKRATLAISDGASLTFSSSSDVVGVATASQVPVVSVASGATLNVPGGMKFANVDIALLGKINVISAGTLTIGYAANGDSTYIGFHSNGGSVFLFHGNNYDASALCICCPESGGTVCVVNDGIVFENMTTIGTHFKEIHYSASFHIGVGNPSSERFDVIFSNTKWGTNGNLFVAGGGTFIMQNGSSFVNSEEYGYYNRHVNVTGAGRIIVGDNSYNR